jgi:hypothetical protein
MHFRLAILAIALAIPTGAFAAQPSQTPTAQDANEKVCENVSQIGSRLSKKRVCATRAEWAERRLQDRKDAEHIQRSINGSTCVGVKNNSQPIC